MHGLAAVHIKAVEAGLRLAAFRAFALLRAARGGKEQTMAVQPHKAALAAQIGQLAHPAVLQQVQAAFVAVVLLVCVGYDKRGAPSVRRVAQAGQVTVV